MQPNQVAVYKNDWFMADRVIKTISTAAERVRRYPKGIVWCARAASEASVSRQSRFVKKGGITLLLVEYHE